MALEPVGGGGRAAMSSLSAALAQLVMLEAAQFAQLSETRAAIAAIEKIAGQTVETSVAAPVAGRRVTSRRAAARRVPVRAVRVSVAAPSPALVRGHHGAAAATERATAILRLIDSGTRAVADIRAALPVPAGASESQHRQSVANALTRLKADGFLVNREDGWALTAKGRKRAAKEEP